MSVRKKRGHKEGVEGVDAPAPKRRKTVTRREIYNAMKRVKAQKAWRESDARGPVNHPQVFAAIVEDFLSYSKEDTPSKQVRFRQALRRVATKLPEFSCLEKLNTKTTGFRVFLKALWDGCKMPQTQTNAKALKSRQEEGLQLALAALDIPENGCSLPKHCVDSKWSLSQNKVYREILDRDSIVCLPNFVNKEAVGYLRGQVKSYLARAGNSGEKLRETTGLGVNGIYFSRNGGWKLPYLRAIQTSIGKTLHLPDNQYNSKAVLLGYGEGGQNWAHQDDNTQYPYQALLLLSQPQKDFDGGQLYVLDGTDQDHWIEREAGHQNAGDVCVFRSNGCVFHGMNTVLSCEDPGGSCPKPPHRVAVGLLQPN